jgi:hypothetical protein
MPGNFVNTSKLMPLDTIPEIQFETAKKVLEIECPKKMSMMSEQNTALCEGCCCTVFSDNLGYALIAAHPRA